MQRCDLFSNLVIIYLQCHNLRGYKIPRVYLRVLAVLLMICLWNTGSSLYICMWDRDKRQRQRDHLSLQVPKSKCGCSTGNRAGETWPPFRPVRCRKLSPSWAKCECLTGRRSEPENLMTAMYPQQIKHLHNNICIPGAFQALECYLKPPG